MTDPDCVATRERLALGEEEALSMHLRRCPSCRSEAEVVRRILSALVVTDLEVQPPLRLDAAIRARFKVAMSGRRAVLRPAPAIAMALAAVGALCAALSVAFAAAGQGALSGSLGAGATALYLAVCTAATVPILIHHVVPSRYDAPEVRP